MWVVLVGVVGVGILREKWNYPRTANVGVVGGGIYRENGESLADRECPCWNEDEE